ncbi:thioredoxin domain-containing protein, partial [Candidatus Microgenomates bacterium]|nr:thioredoxin domain-containing protein [Candidatus Microgenomates bacterium]
MAAEENQKLSSTNLTPFLIALLVVAAFVIGALYTKMQYLEKTQSPTSQTSQTPLQGEPSGRAPTVGTIRPVSDSDHIRGSKDARLSLVEYSDLECPFCKSFHPTMQKILQDYDGKVRWVYRHFPLDSIHPKARPAALAAECVASLGGNDKFWNHVDKLFEGAPVTLTDDQLKTIATGLGVNASQFD